MSNWISSKLKAAETILQQIDQQAAESLKKNDATSSPTNHTAIHGGDQIHSKKLDPSPSLKFQLPSKKATPPSPSPVPTPPDIPTPKSRTSTSDPSVIDWTELLSSPDPKVSIKKKVIKKPVVVAIKEEVIEESAVEKEEEEEEEGKGDEGSGSSSSGSGSDSEYDSEEERKRREERRKRREEMIAEKAKEAAVKAIKEREDAVARLEGEKESLEKIMEERAKQQAQEASELQMNMMETMEAVDLEKEKHNSTRMEAFARVAKLEAENAELARSLATAQWNLEVEVNRISELRQEIELKEHALEDRRKNVLKIHQKRSSSREVPLHKDELEKEILDAEHSLLCNKTAQLKDKAKMLEKNIESTRRERVYPTEVELELKKRLAQLTDHLIQKQSQVEALSSEKATLSLRIEMLSRLLDENSSAFQTTDTFSNDAKKGLTFGFDIEAGTWQRLARSEALRNRMRLGRQHLGSILQQLDTIFSAGVIFLRKNPMAQVGALLYLLCLHIWVSYVLFSSHPQVSDSTSHGGAVFSLDVINKTLGP